MKEFEDPLDLLNDDGDGVIEMCLLEEEKKQKKNIDKNSGCCVLFLMLSSSLVISGWCISNFV
jgi:hypothetical protein